MRFELKKLFSSVFMWICLGIVIAVMVVYVVVPVNAAGSRRDYKAFLKHLNSQNLSEDELIKYLNSGWNKLISKCGELDDERFNVKGEYSENIWGDFMLFDRALTTAKYVFKEIPKNRTAIVKDSLRIISEENAKAEPDMGVIRTNRLAVSQYNRVINCELKDTGEFDTAYSVYDNTPWDYVMIVFTVILTVRMFSLDISGGSDRMIFSSVNGRKKLYFKQLSACAIVVGGLVLLHTLCQLVVGAFAYGVDDFSLPIQMVKRYEFCPFNISIGGYYALKTFGKLLFYYACVSLAALIAVISRKALPSAAAAIILCLAPDIIANRFYTISAETSIAARETLDVLRCFLPQSLLNAEMYFRDFDYVELFGFPISRLVCVMVVTVIIVIAGIAVSCRSFGRETR